MVDPGNPHDFTQAEIDELVEELQQAEPDAEVVSHFRDETEYGGGIAELIHLWVELKGAGIEFRHLVNEGWPSIAFVATAVAWLRKRWRKDTDQSPRPRPRQLRVYDQESRRLIQIDIDLPDGEPKALLGDADRHHHDKPVSARRRNPDPKDNGAEDPEDDTGEA
jgi:hypothetical protein